MRTRSNFYPFNSTATIPSRSNRRRIPNIVEPKIRTIEEIVSMVDRTMEELFQAPTDGYGEAIVTPKILAENFNIKTNLLQLVEANKFHGFERDNPNTHIINFKRMIATLKYRDVLNDAIKLMLFSYSLEGAAKIWYEKEPPNSILTWDDLVNKFVNQFFPPSKTTHLKNEISRFTPRFEETFREAWDRFKEMLRACPHHEFSEETQIDTLYNGLTEQDQDSLNAASGEVEKTCVTCGGAHAYYDFIAIDGNQPSVCAATGSYNQVSPPNRASHQIPPPGFAPVQNNPNSFFQNQPSTLGTLLSNTVPNPKGEMKAVTTRSGLAYEGPSIPTNSFLVKVDEQNTKEILGKDHSNSSESTTQVQPPVVLISIPKPDVSRTQTKPTIPYPSRLNDQKLREKATNQMEKFFQIFHDLHFDISFADALLLMPKFASTIKSLLTNKDKLFELAKVSLNENCSAMLLKKIPEKLGDPGKFLIHCDFLGMGVCHALADLGASINLMPLSIWKKLSLPELTPTRMTLELANRLITPPKGDAEDVFVKVGKFHISTDFVVVYFEADPRVPLILGRSFLRTGRSLIDVYGEEITLRVKDEFSSNPTLVYENDVSKEPIVKSSSPTLTPFGEGDFFLEIEDFLNDDSIPTKIDNSFYDPKGDIIYLENFLKEDPFQLPLLNLKQAKSPIEEPEYLLSMRYEHLSTTLATELDEVTESSAKNLIPIPTFLNPLFSDNDDFTSNDNESIPEEDVSIEEFKVYSHLLFDDDEINSDEIDPHCLNVESNLVESLSNHDALIDSSLKFDYLEEFIGALMPTSIVGKERIRREHAEYISLMERLITINPCPRRMENANTIVTSLPSSPIPVQDSNSQREEIDIFTSTDGLLPSSFKNDDYDSEGEIYVLEELLVDNSIPSSENELSDFHQDDPSFPRPLSEPPDVEFNFEPNSVEVISAVMNNIEELNEDECFDLGGKMNVFTNVEDDDYFPFMFVTRNFLPYLIYHEVSPLLLFVGSEDTIFDLGISV
nr:reverse transcriptase domain-containing protein [Tanacetum cinerariifolium]